jgi:DNA-binding response OmpR family regulator
MDQAERVRESILVVCDDVPYFTRLSTILESYGYRVKFTADLIAAVTMARSQTVGLGLYVAPRIGLGRVGDIKALRLALWGSPLMAIADSNAGTVRELLLKSGADGCIRADCPDSELVAYVDAAIRFAQRLTALPLFGGGFNLDVQARRLTRGSGPSAPWVGFPMQEFVLVRALAMLQGETLAHAEIDLLLWGRSKRGDDAGRYRVVHRANKHLGFLGGIAIRSDSGMGYRLCLTEGTNP